MNESDFLIDQPYKQCHQKISLWQIGIVKAFLLSLIRASLTVVYH